MPSKIANEGSSVDSCGVGAALALSLSTSAVDEGVSPKSKSEEGMSEQGKSESYAAGSAGLDGGGGDEGGRSRDDQS